MKVKSKRTQVQANRVFTDREVPRESFWKKYMQCKECIKNDEGEIVVLAYYGIGGIGKSTLLRKLIEEMDEKIDKPVHIFFDFDIKHEKKDVLISLRNLLSEQYNFQFPLFDLAIYNYALKIGEDVDSPDVQAIVDRSPMLSSVLDVAQEIPLIGMLPKLVVAADRGVTLVKNLVEKHKRNVYAIESDNVKALYDRLPELFAADLAEETSKLSEPLVFLLDTYEQLVNEMSASGEPLLNDEWLRGDNGLIQNVPNVLWVIAGREKLKWERFDIGWHDALEQHILGALSETDAMNFLASAGINDDDLRKQLYELTQGTPVYLDLCVDRYVNLIGDGICPQISDFGNDIYSLIERFARYIDNSKKDMIYVLSCLKVWDDEMISNVLGSGIGSFSFSTYEIVKGFSFISATSDNSYHIHQTVGDILEKNCPEILRNKVLKLTVDYYYKKMMSLSSNNFSYSSYLARMCSYGLKIVDENEVINFFETYINDAEQRLYEAAYYDTAQDIVDMLIKYADERNNKYIRAKANVEQVELLISEGKASSALDLAKEAYGFYCENLGNFATETNAALYQLCRVMHQVGMFDEALVLIKNGIDQAVHLYGKESIERVQFMRLQARVLENLGNDEAALALYNELCPLQACIQGEDNEDYLQTLRFMSGPLLSLGNIDEAIELDQQILEKSKRVLGEEHPLTLNAMASLSGDYTKAGMHEKAYEIDKDVYIKRTEILGDAHPSTHNAMFSLAVDLQEIALLENTQPRKNELLQEALEIRDKLLNRRIELFGMDDIDTMESYNSMAWTYYLMEEYEKALPYINKAIELHEKNNISFDEWLEEVDTLILVKSGIGLHEEAIELAKKQVNETKSREGISESWRSMTLFTLAKVCKNANKVEESIQYAKEAYDISKRHYGEEHSHTVQIREWLSE